MNKDKSSNNVLGAITGSCAFALLFWVLILLWVLDVDKKNKR